MRIGHVKRAKMLPRKTFSEPAARQRLGVRRCSAAFGRSQSARALAQSKTLRRDKWFTQWMMIPSRRIQPQALAVWIALFSIAYLSTDIRAADQDRQIVLAVEDAARLRFSVSGPA